MKISVKIVLLSVIIFFCHGIAGSEKGESEAAGNLASIKNLYHRWNEGPEGSRNFFRELLNDRLSGMIGREIKSDFDYRIDFTDISGKQTFISGLRSGRWLRIHGELAGDSLKFLSGLGNSRLKEIERNGELFSLSGKISSFILSEANEKRSITLILERVYVELMNTRKKD